MELQETYCWLLSQIYTVKFKITYEIVPVLHAFLFPCDRIHEPLHGLATCKWQDRAIACMIHPFAWPCKLARECHYIACWRCSMLSDVQVCQSMQFELLSGCQVVWCTRLSENAVQIVVRMSVRLVVTMLELAKWKVIAKIRRLSKA